MENNLEKNVRNYEHELLLIHVLNTYVKHKKINFVFTKISVIFIELEYL